MTDEQQEHDSAREGQGQGVLYLDIGEQQQDQEPPSDWLVEGQAEYVTPPSEDKKDPNSFSIGGFLKGGLSRISRTKSRSKAVGYSLPSADVEGRPGGVEDPPNDAGFHSATGCPLGTRGMPPQHQKKRLQTIISMKAKQLPQATWDKVDSLGIHTRILMNKADLMSDLGYVRVLPLPRVLNPAHYPIQRASLSLCSDMSTIFLPTPGPCLNTRY